MWNEYQPREGVAAALASGVSLITAFRQGEGVSLNVLAQATDISPDRLLQIEGGKIPTEDELLDISNALAIPIPLLNGTYSLP